MKEFDVIVAGVKQALAAKKEEIDKSGVTVIAYVNEAFLKRQREVNHFEQSLFQFTCTVSQKSTFIEKYTRDAQELLGSIGKILV